MTATTPCPTCLGSGIDSKRAATPLAMPGLAAHVAAMYPCPACNGAGRIPRTLVDERAIDRDRAEARRAATQHTTDELDDPTTGRDRAEPDFPRAAALSRTTRRLINETAWRALLAGRITAAQYQHRVDRANAMTDAPYHLTQPRTADLP